jgi:hypothetical protein
MKRSLAALTFLSLLAFGAAPAAADRSLELVDHPQLASASVDPTAISADGRTIVFETSAQMLPDDADSSNDVYSLSGGQLTLASDRVQPGADGEAGVRFAGMSDDGRHIVFTTEEPLVSADMDGASQDVYEFANGQTLLVSDVSGAIPDADKPADFKAISADGGKVFFQTNEHLVSADGDDSADIYERSSSGVRMRSDRTSGTDQERNATAAFISRDGSQVVFETRESMSSQDGDDSQDVYLSSTAGSNLDLSLVSDRVSNGPDTEQVARLRDAAPDGSALIFSSAEQVTDGDSDSVTDIFLRRGGQTVIASDARRGGIDGPEEPGRALLSDDGVHVFFEHDGQLDAADTDTSRDVYGFQTGRLDLLSDRQRSGPEEAKDVGLDGVTPALGAIMETTEQLVDADDDGRTDLYGATSGPPRLLSDRTTPGRDADSGVSARTSGSVLFLTTSEPLVAADTDSEDDVYESTAAGLELLADAPSGNDENKPVDLRASTPDGSLALVLTDEALLPADSDAGPDTYLARRVAPPLPPGPPAGGGGGGGGTPPAQPGSPAGPAGAADLTAPSLARLTIAKRLTIGKAATIRFTSSEAGRATLTFERVTCRKRSKRARRCTKRFQRIGKARKLNAVAGANRVKFKPGRGFKPGDYRLRLNARDAAGNKAAEKRANFKLAAHKKRR